MSLYKLLLAEAFSLPAYNVEQNLPTEVVSEWLLKNYQWL